MAGHCCDADCGNRLTFCEACDLDEDRICDACCEGVVGGSADGSLRHNSVATRAHVAKMRMNFLNQ